MIKNRTDSLNIRFAWIFLASLLFYAFSLFLIPTRAEYVDLAIISGNYDYASQLLTPVLAEKKPPVWSLRDASRVSVLQGYPKRAARYLERLVAEDPEEYQDRLELARLYLDQYQPGKAAVQLYNGAGIQDQTGQQWPRLQQLLS